MPLAGGGAAGSASPPPAPPPPPLSLRTRAKSLRNERNELPDALALALGGPEAPPAALAPAGVRGSGARAGDALQEPWSASRAAAELERRALERVLALDGRRSVGPPAGGGIGLQRSGRALVERDREGRAERETWASLCALV
jgi:hypothetical protein